ncbi:chloride channel protein [Tepidiphilus sp. B18-69]|uniref:Chloride channel protein n=2 Tax=Tepidiphilus baoligensis TaxID=2698687 RepID=A0ABX1QQY4_9PROT|nr:chloride channel protein [Tepidiphilus baoligensis]NMH17305.1 chloride channel protein [Tepidiphilus baoligensis]
MPENDKPSSTSTRRSQRLQRLTVSLRRWEEELPMVFAACLVGLLSVGFAKAAEWAIEFHAALLNGRPWIGLLLSPLGFAAIAWITLRFFPSATGSGIPQAIAASLSTDGRLRRSLLSIPIALGKILLTTLGLLCGASIGREGPTVQVASSVMYALAGKRKRRRLASSHALIVAGGGAGVAAAFNTPLGGILFAIEEMSHRRAFQANGTLLTAVIFSGIVSLLLLGNYTYFGRTDLAMGMADGWKVVLAMGIACGLMGSLYARALIALSHHGLPGRAGQWAKRHPIYLAAACGLGTAVLGWVTGGDIYGTGYQQVKSALEGEGMLPWYFFLAKMAAITLAFVSRIPGGVFAPALAVGAGLGSLVAMGFPGLAPNVFLVLGMVGFLSALTQTPITAFVIVMEMTANHEVLLPLMATSLIAFALSRTLIRTPLYHALARDTLRSASERLKQQKLVHQDTLGN